MGKIEHTFKDGDVLYANQLNPIVNAINDNADQIADLRGMTIENVQTGTIEAQSNHYYNVTDDVDTLAVTLPTITPGKTSVVKVHFIAGMAPVMAINGGDVRVIYSMNQIVAHDEYVLTITYNGLAWVVTAEVLTPNDCLVFQSQSAFELTFLQKNWLGDLQYSTNGITWQDVELNAPMQSADDSMRHILMLRGHNTGHLGAGEDEPIISLTGTNVDCIGNIMSLIDYKAPGSSISSQYTFAHLFYGCTALRSAPTIPDKCVSGSSAFLAMFEGCTSLVNAPELTFGTMGTSFFESMFKGCTSLVNAPKLTISTGGTRMCKSMFEGCTSLANAPELTPISLGNNCYESMFKGCTSLVTAPELPAITLKTGCYKNMFEGCSSLNSITMKATNVSASDCLTDWVKGVAASGTFTKDANTSLPTGDSGIPDGWEVVNV